MITGETYMTQLTEEQRERLEQIREIVNGPNFYYQGMFFKSRDDQQFLGDALLLLQETFSLLDSDSQVAEGIPDDLPYRIVEEMGLGLTFRSCTCGQLPCARLRPLRDALATVGRNAATRMRDKCVEKVEEAVWLATIDFKGILNETQRRAIALATKTYLEAAVKTGSLTLEPLEPEKQ